MNREEFEEMVESICAKGCIEVNQTIILLEKEKASSHLDYLSHLERQLLLKELKSIMGVYGEKVCSL
jgi:hypothetical protein